MTILITVIHVIVCLFLIAVVLLQSGKSGDLAAAFGGQGSQTAFGPRGAASVLSRATTWSAIIFMLTSITLSIYAARKTGPTSVLSGVKATQTKSQPATPLRPRRRQFRRTRRQRRNKGRAGLRVTRNQQCILTFLRTCHLTSDLPLRPFLQERILFPFRSDGRFRAVPRNHDRLIRQSQHAVVQRAHDLLERSSGEIGSSNAAGEQRVAGNQ